MDPRLQAIIGADSSGFHAEMRGLSGGVHGLARDCVKWGKIAAAGLGALAVPLGLAANKGMQFERQMSRVRAIVNPTAKDFEALNKTAKRLGETTEKTATEVAGAIQSLGQAGFETQQIQETLSSVLDLSTLTGLEMAQTATMVTDSLNQFNLSTERANDVASVFAYTQSRTNTSAQQLAEGLKYVGASAGQIGWSIEETSAALGVLADNALKGSTGGMSLNMALMRMLRPTGEAKDLIQKYGISLRTASGEMKSLTDWMGELTDANMTVEEMATVFGVRGVRAIQALTTAQKEMGGETLHGAEVMRQLTQDIQENSDYAQKAAEMVRSDTTGAFEALSSAVEATSLALFDHMKDGLGAFVGKVLVPGVRALTAWITNSEGLKQVMDGLFGTMAELTEEGFLMLEALGPAFETLLGMTFEEDMGFVGFIRSIREGVQEVGPLLPEYIETAREHLRDLINTASEGWTEINEMTVGWESIRDVVADVVSVVGFLYDGVKTVGAGAHAMVKGLSEAFGEFAAWLIDDQISNAVRRVQEAWDSLMAVDVSGWWRAIEEHVQQFINLAPLVLEGGQKIASAWIEGFTGYLKEKGRAGIAAALGPISRYLVGQSPPPEGPLSDIDIGGQKTAEAWIHGMVQGLDNEKDTLLAELETMIGAVNASPFPICPEEQQERLDALKEMYEMKERIILESEGRIADGLSETDQRVTRQREQEAKARKQIELDELKLRAEMADAALTITGAFLGQQHSMTKAMGVANAIINTHEGATRALSSYPPPKSWMMALRTVALGYQQVRAIRGSAPSVSSSIPSIASSADREGMSEYGGDYEMAFARGGIVQRPTRALIGEAGPEAVIPLDRLESLIAAQTAAVMQATGSPGSGGEQTVRVVVEFAGGAENRFDSNSIEQLADALNRFVTESDGRLVASEARFSQATRPRLG